MAGHHHHHDHVGDRSQQNERALWLALIPTALFMVAEVAGGILTQSLALLSDAMHMATDVFGVAVAIVAIRLARRPPDLRRTFGYERLEILAAIANAVILFGVGFYILFEAYQRLNHPPQIQSNGMLAIALLGLVVNAFAMWALSSGKDESLNLKGAYLEVWSDFIGSIGVILAAIIIRFTGWTIVDTIVAIAIGLWVVPRTWILFRDAANILLEGVPRGIKLEEVLAAISGAKGVTDVHDLHVWALTGGRVCLTAHVVAESRAEDYEALIAELNEVLHERFAIGHVTIQYERTPCPDAAQGHRFL
ncbi:MAG TPA: cation diffusion facilitator family transporter [Xanthobacteraceae bacterium]|nr:cation diffusion facilitator family transporter [Xanthobacteraceae bacterium]